MTRMVKAVTGVDSDIYRHGFTLPTVLISSIILIAMLVLSVQMSTSTQSALRDQYYQQLSREAAEAGGQMVKECWSIGQAPAGSVLTPKTNCAGTSVSGQSGYVIDRQNMKSSFRVKVELINLSGAQASIEGKVELMDPSTGQVYKAYAYNQMLQRSLEVDPVADRASQRFWFFGIGGGLDFGKSGTAWPSPITSGGSAYEGSTVVTDREGNLVFWTDGRTIRNKNKQVAHNAEGLLGSASATQAVAAFPLNYEQTRFGVVSNTTGEDASRYLGSPFTANQKHRLYYHEYDTRLDGGAGGVVSGKKNIDLWPAADNNGYASEALGAMPNHDGTGYWVYTFSKDIPAAPYGNRILGFLIGNDGTVRQRLTFFLPTRPLLCGQSNGASGSVYGTINFSKDYSKMLLMIGTSGCIRDYNPDNADYPSSGTVYILDTNRQTGALTQSKSWRARTNTALTNPRPKPTSGTIARNSGYSADFSPDENFIYVTQLYPGWITRYHANASDPSLTQHTLSHTTRSTNSNLWTSELWESGGQVRRGPDGRMYVSMNGKHATDSIQKRQIICITNPDVAGYPTLATLGWSNPCPVALPPGAYSWYGLPQMVTSYYPRIIYY